MQYCKAITLQLKVNTFKLRMVKKRIHWERIKAKNEKKKKEIIEEYL